jgi:hypothetical protein
MSANLHAGSVGFDVALLQLQLNLKGVPSPNLRVDGSFGSLTLAAVIAFQRRAGLSADGVVGPLTQAELARGLSLTAVHHRLHHISQPTASTCWAAATAMITETSVASVRMRTPAAMVASDGGLINSSESDQAVVTGSRYGAIHGLRCNAPMSWSVGGLLDLLRAGPLMLDMLWNTADYTQGHGSPGHMVVVSAVVSDGHPNGEHTHLLVLDPWPPHRGRLSWVEYAHWMQEVPTRTYRVFERL